MAFKQKKFTWWTNDLRLRRNKLTALFKKATREDAPLILYRQYKQERAQYRRQITETKRRAWENFCRSQTDPFGRARDLAFEKFNDKLVTFITAKSSSSPPASRASAFWNLTEGIFGRSTPVSHQQQLPSSNSEEQFTISELRDAIFSFKKSKAPGPDSIDHSMVRAIFESLPQTLLDLYNTALRLNYFPESWKLGEMVFFRKEGRPDNDPTSFRPITLLPILGKVYEKLILKRVQFNLFHSGKLSGKQHGYMERRSTETALRQVISLITLSKENKNYTSLISLDFKGAFDNLPWSAVLSFLLKLGLPLQLINILLSFLTNRRALVDWLLPNLIYYFHRGCPQGSVLGPFLWVALLETLLNSFSFLGCELVSYADDVLQVVSGRTRAELESRGNMGLSFIQNWASSNNLLISKEKSSVLNFGKPKSLKRPPQFKLDKINIKTVNNLQYLGVILDRQLNFLPHLNQKRKESLKIIQSLFRFTSLSGRLPPQFLQIWYSSILQRKVAYASGVWFQHMWPSHGTRLLLSIQRQSLLLISRAYRNTSTQALQVLLGIPPLDLQLKAEATLTSVVRLGISSDRFFAPEYESKAPCAALDPSRRPINQCLTSSFTGEVILYTDGSKTASGTAAAFCAYQNEKLIHTWQSKLDLQNSVFQAELFAIFNAIRWGSVQPYTSFLIRTDSLSSLQALDRLQIDSYLQQDIINLIISSDKLFSFNWVRGHSGVEGNELADSLANSATTGTGVPTSFLPTPSSFLKRMLHQELLQGWQHRWDTSDVGRYTYKFINKISTTTPIYDRNIIIFLTNHGPFQQHLFKINSSDSPNCVCGAISDSKHYIFSCNLTKQFHIKKHRNMNLVDWFRTIRNTPSLLRKISNCVDLLEREEHNFSFPV